MLPEKELLLALGCLAIWNSFSCLFLVQEGQMYSDTQCPYLNVSYDAFLLYKVILK